jgi:sec-independent protein translocase protein TatA
MQWWHWLLIVAAFVILFGAKKLPDAARGVGRSLRILKAEVGEMQAERATTAPAPAAVATADQAASPLAAPQPVHPEPAARRIA